MNAARPPGAPTFRSALLTGGEGGGALGRRPIGRTLTLSILLHVGAGVTLVVLSLLTIDPIQVPPIVIRFLIAAPPPPRVAPLRERQDLKRPEPPPPEHRRPESLASIPALRLPPPPPAPPRRPDPPPLKTEPVDLSIHSAEAPPEPVIRDQAPPGPRAGREVSIDAVRAEASRPSGSGPEPELSFLVPGRARAHDRVEGLAGRGDGLPPLPGPDPLASSGYAAAGSGAARAGGQDPDSESGPATGGIASFLGRKYGVVLIEAARLGKRTSDGSRYSLIVPLLSEAYRQIRVRGAWRAPARGEELDSARISAAEVAIRYADGTLHVIVPTGDGLVALYVGAGRGGRTDRSKVQEAERALAALRRLAQERG
ncbi:MAG TPA: hypothetical protein VFT43_04250 [Candidatus Polarisedimenticolia bacterium]|nr:hypothetical protein [Candidatus Polarisedimenticolia bacterium]